VNRLTHRLIALIAAYAIALQAVLAGFAMLATAAHAAPELCVAAGHGPIPGSTPLGPDCAACPLQCGGAGPDGFAPAALTLVPPTKRSFGVAHRVAAVVLGAAARLLPPSRAPPVA
jgi:hypothetical protein